MPFYFWRLFQCKNILEMIILEQAPREERLYLFEVIESCLVAFLALPKVGQILRADIFNDFRAKTCENGLKNKVLFDDCRPYRRLFCLVSFSLFISLLVFF